MSRVIAEKTFDDLMSRMAYIAISEFKCNTSKIDNVVMIADSTSCPNTRDYVKSYPKKMIQLRRLYVTENELDRSHSELTKTGESDFRFNNVQHQFDHIKGGCLQAMHITPEEVTIKVRASVIPYNLQFDLVLISDLLKELGVTPKRIVFNVGYVRSKIIHALLWFLSHGWTPEEICKYRYGRSAIRAYMRGRAPTCKYRNWIRFSGRVDKYRKEHNIPELLPILEKAVKENPDPICLAQPRDTINKS